MYEEDIPEKVIVAGVLGNRFREGRQENENESSRVSIECWW